MRYVIDIFSFVMFCNLYMLYIYIYNIHDSSVKGVATRRPLVLVLSQCVNYLLDVQAASTKHRRSQLQCRGRKQAAPGNGKAYDLALKPWEAQSDKRANASRYKKYQDSFRTVVVCHDVSICQNFFLISCECA